MSIQILCPFSKQINFVVVVVVLLLNCMNSLYIFAINPLSDGWFASIFSYPIGCLFTLLIASFAMQKLFSLM